MSAEPSLKHQEQSNKLIYWSLGTIFLIAASLNYDALRHFAYDQAEVNYYLSFFVPLLVDVLIATAVYITLINEESGEKPGLAWSVVIAFTCGSIYLNYLHYPKTVPGYTMSAFIPLVVFVASELSKQQMQIRARRDSVIITLEKLREKVKTLTAETVKIEADNRQLQEAKAQENRALETQKAELQAELQALDDAIKQARSTLKDIEILPTKLDPRAIKAIQFDALTYAGMTQAQAADLLGHTPKTLKSYVDEYVNGDGLSKRKGA